MRVRLIGCDSHDGDLDSFSGLYIKGRRWHCCSWIRDWTLTQRWRCLLQSTMLQATANAHAWYLHLSWSHGMHHSSCNLRSRCQCLPSFLVGGGFGKSNVLGLQPIPKPRKTHPTAQVTLSGSGFQH